MASGTHPDVSDIPPAHSWVTAKAPPSNELMPQTSNCVGTGHYGSEISLGCFNLAVCQRLQLWPTRFEPTTEYFFSSQACFCALLSLGQPAPRGNTTKAPPKEESALSRSSAFSSSTAGWQDFCTQFLS